MKRYLLTGLILALPVAALLNHATPASAMQQQPTYSITDQWHQNFLNDMQLFQGLFTRTSNHHQSQQQLQQLNQFLNDMNQLNQQMMVDQAVIHRSGVRKLPRQTTTGRAQQTVTSGIKLAAGDNTVSQNTLQTAVKIIQNITLPTLQQQLNQKPSSDTEIALFSSKRSYGQALLQAGVPSDQIQAIVTNTGGITIGNSDGMNTHQGSVVWIPLYNLKSEADLANVLTHELTHVIVNQEGMGDTLPTWVNEGIAWHDGLLGESKVDDRAVKSEEAQENQMVSRVAQAGRLLPLNASEDDILKADYNVEWVDYLAVERLIQKYGDSEFRSFLNEAPTLGVEQSFQKHFGQSLSDFEQNFEL